MVSNRFDVISRRIIRASGALLAAAVLAGCGQQSQNVGATAPSLQQAAPADPVASESAPPVSGTSAANPARITSEPQTPESTATRSPGRTSVTRTPDGTSVTGTPAAGTTQRAPSIGRCHTSMLTGSLRAGHPGAGQRYAELVLRNDSNRSCTVYGYPGLLLVDSSGRSLPTEVNRAPQTGPESVRLATGESATATLHWGVVPTGDEPVDGPCRPEPTRLEVIPPDETDPLTVSWPFGPVCGGGSIDTTAFH